MFTRMDKVYRIDNIYTEGARSLCSADTPLVTTASAGTLHISSTPDAESQQSKPSAWQHTLRIPIYTAHSPDRRDMRRITHAVADAGSQQSKPSATHVHVPICTAHSPRTSRRNSRRHPTRTRRTRLARVRCSPRHTRRCRRSRRRHRRK